MSDTAADCLFCQIARREVPADIVHETATTLAFRDVQPQAPTHVLVIPKRHEPDLGALVRAAPPDLVDVLLTVAEVAEIEGIGAGYRTVANTGARAQQSVFHAHVHVLGGRDMSWPPG